MHEPILPERSVPQGPRQPVPQGPRQSVPQGPRQSVPQGPRQSVPQGPRQPVLVLVSALLFAAHVGFGLPPPAVAAVHQGAGDGNRLMFDPARRDFLVGRLPRDLAPIDFDEDGKMDAACLRFNFVGPGQVELLRGDGAGGFERFASLSTAGGATSIAVADLNEDGHDDLITSGFLDHNLGLHFGNGDGDFAFVSLPLPGEAPFHVVTADIDDDQHLDLIAAAGASQEVIVMRGDGQGGFTLLIQLPAGVQPQNVAAGDLSGDGAVDLAVADSDGDQLYLFLGDGAGGFAPPQVLAPGTRPVWIDIEEGVPGSPSLMAVALRNDDLVRIYEWDTGLLTPVEIAALPAGQNPQALRFARLTGEAIGLAVAAQSSDELVLYAALDATAQEFITQDSPTAVAIADWSGDGVDDLLLPGFNTESISLHLGDGAGGVRQAASVETPGAVASIQPIDYDGDARPDLAVLRLAERRVTVLRGLSPTQFESIDVGELLPQLPTGFAALDVDQDDLPDFATGQATGSQLWILKSSEDYARSTFTMGGSGPTAIVAADLDRDGHDDLAVSLFLNSMVAIMLSDRAGGFALPQLVPVGLEPEHLVVGDWNLDGRLDLATVNGGERSISILLQDEQGAFQAASPLAVDVGRPTALAVGLLIGGRHQDLVVVGSIGLEVLRGDGAGGFTSVQRIETAAEFESARVADMNGDGWDDVVAADRLGNGVVIFPGRPSRRRGSLDEQIAFGTERGPVDLTVLDLDADGALDLAVVARLADRVSLLVTGRTLSPTRRGGTAADSPNRAGAPGAPAILTAVRAVAWPNPFHRRTELHLALGDHPAGWTEIVIYDVSGRLIATPFSGHLDGSTSATITWDGRDLRGARAPRGVYFYRVELQAADRVLRGRIVRH